VRCLVRDITCKMAEARTFGRAANGTWSEASFTKSETQPHSPLNSRNNAERSGVMERDNSRRPVLGLLLGGLICRSELQGDFWSAACRAFVASPLAKSAASFTLSETRYRFSIRFLVRRRKISADLNTRKSLAVGTLYPALLHLVERSRLRMCEVRTGRCLHDRGPVSGCFARMVDVCRVRVEHRKRTALRTRG
jgi:hypothetical protein